MAQRLEEDDLTLEVLSDIRGVLKSIRYWVIVLVVLAVLPLLFGFVAVVFPR